MNPPRHTAHEYRRRICAAMNLISRNLDRDLSLDEIAAAAAFSRFHFHRVFKVVVGETVAAFTRRLRLESAASRLQYAPDEPVTTVALDYGFSSSQNFARAFRRHFGVSPTEYRNSKPGHTVRNDGNAASLQAAYDPDSAFTNTFEYRWRNTMNAEVRDMPAYHVAYVRKLGPYGKETCEAAFGELARWAGPRGHFAGGTMLGVYWDNPEVTPPAKCRVDACLTVPEGTVTEGAVGIQTIPGGPHAVCRFEIQADSFQTAWDDAFAWLVSQGHECADRPCYELYHNNGATDPGGTWIFDICIPLKARS